MWSASEIWRVNRRSPWRESYGRDDEIAVNMWTGLPMGPDGWTVGREIWFGTPDLLRCEVMSVSLRVRLAMTTRHTDDLDPWDHRHMRPVVATVVRRLAADERTETAVASLCMDAVWAFEDGGLTSADIMQSVRITAYGMIRAQTRVPVGPQESWPRERRGFDGTGWSKAKRWNHSVLWCIRALTADADEYKGNDGRACDLPRVVDMAIATGMTWGQLLQMLKEAAA